MKRQKNNRAGSSRSLTFAPRLECLESRCLLSGVPRLVSDINTTPQFSQAQPIIVIGDSAYFLASDGKASFLWTTDGTDVGTRRVKDITRGAAGVAIGLYPGSAAAVNDTLFFIASDGLTGLELWRSDGTEAGTHLVKDIRPGTGHSNIGNITAVGNTLFFSADDGVSGPELWKSDGTASGTIRVKDIEPGAGGSGPRNLTDVNGTLFFSAFDGVNGLELWKSDGTNAGTLLVKDILPGTGSSDPMQFINMGEVLYFAAFDGARGRELWKSDGTEAGTVIVKDIRDGSGSSWFVFGPRMIQAEGTLYFIADDGATGFELWKSDGTETGTILVADIMPGAGTPFDTYPRRKFASVGSTVFFAADDGVTGRELWKSDGTEAGTTRVRDIRPGMPGSDPWELTSVGNTLYFRAGHTLADVELWKTDGTETGTVRVKDIKVGQFGSLPDSLKGLDGRLLFWADDGVVGNELWASDGTENGTELVIDVRNGTNGSDPQHLTAGGSRLFFADDGSVPERFELWTSDGTASGTSRLVDRNTVYNVAEFTDVNGTVFFRGIAPEPDENAELWKTDGTPSGTVLVKAIVPGTRGSSPGNFVVVENIVYFWANSFSQGPALWRSDGTAIGTYQLTPNGSYPISITNANGRLFFSATDDELGRVLWMLDGGTLVRFPGIEPDKLTAVGDLLFFLMSDAATGTELWKSDGTIEGTRRVKDIQPGPAGSSPDKLANVGGTLFFTADDGTSGIELWKSDGTEAGTVRVKNIRAGNNLGAFNSLRPGWFTDVDGFLFFSATDGSTNWELWKSDGTDAGTVRIKDIRAGRGSYPSQLTNIAGTVFFTATDDAHGTELWKTDGTEAGTVRLEILPDAPGSYPEQLTSLNGTLYFSANDGISGRELWAVDPPAGDFDRNHYVNSRDVDVFYSALTAGSSDPKYDLTGDGVVDFGDFTHLITAILGTRLGDMNLSGQVDRTDLATLARNYGRTDNPSWREGDVNGDATVDATDLALLQANLNAESVAVPSGSAARSTARRAPTPHYEPRPTITTAQRRRAIRPEASLVEGQTAELNVLRASRRSRVQNSHVGAESARETPLD